jgi:hypothetical protein
MTTSLLLAFLNGAVAMASILSGTVFLAYWRDSRDRLFVHFAIAFWILALNWILVALIAPAAEQRHWFYVLRLFAFVLILVGIADKNRRSEP